MSSSTTPEGSEAPMLLREVAALSLGLAGLTAALQVTILLTFRSLVHEYIPLPQHFVWMTPIAYAIVFGCGGILLWFFGKCMRRTPRRRTFLICLLCFALLCLSMLFPRIWEYARVVLSIGVAMQLTLWLDQRWHRVSRPLFVSGIGAAAALLAAGWLFQAAIAWRERERLRKLSAPAVGAPNVLVIILDTVRAMSMSLYGHARITTPRLDRFAREGVVFDRAYSTAPWTLPSHASLLTGRLPHELSASHLVPLNSEHGTITERFRDHGYATGAVMANLHYTGRHSGLDRGFLHYDDTAVGFDQIMWNVQARQSALLWEFHTTAVELRSPLLSLVALARFKWSYPGRFAKYQRRWAEEVNESFLAWLGTIGQRPFFAMLNYFDAHEPYEPPEPFLSRFDSSGIDGPKLLLRTTPNVLEHRYEGSLAYLDHHVGNLLDSLNRRGVLDQTIVVITSDHGEHFGERGLWEHANSVYPQVTHIPAVIRYPPKLSGALRISTPVSLCDLGPTILELAGLPTQALGTCTSLVPLMQGERHARSVPVISGLLPYGRGTGKSGRYTFSVVDDSLHYVRWNSGLEELFNHRKDAVAEHDLVGPSSSQNDLARLRAALRQAIGPALWAQISSPALPRPAPESARP